MDVRMAFFDAQPESEMVRVIRIKKRKYFIMIYFKFTKVFNSSQWPGNIGRFPLCGTSCVTRHCIRAPRELGISTPPQAGSLLNIPSVL